MKPKNALGLVIYSFVILVGCGKGFLEAKPDKSLVLVSSITDRQGLLDNRAVVNQYGETLTELATDNIFIPDNVLKIEPLTEISTYSWSTQIPGMDIYSLWPKPYTAILFANTALSGIDNGNLVGYGNAAWKNVKGSALFVRAYHYWMLTNVFSRQYTKENANVELGVPLKLTPDISTKVDRAKLGDCMNQVLSDLHQSANFLTDTKFKVTEPSKAAVFALLSRIYLQIQKYDSAKIYADSSLAINSYLMDFNKLDSTKTYSILYPNNEILFEKRGAMISGLSYDGRIDTNLIKLYSSDDLRRVIFFRKSGQEYFFRGSYIGARIPFVGLAVDEVLLNRAEANCRLSNLQASLDDLNKLLTSRWRTGKFTPLTLVDQPTLLKSILMERRKELVVRGLRWFDLRRLNLDPNTSTYIDKVIGGAAIHISPNDKRYVFPIPETEVTIGGYEQNSRQ